MNKQNIIKFYELLKHENQTEIRCLKLDKNFKPLPKETKIFFVSSQEEFLKKCKEQDGKYNLYSGLNERKLNCKEAKDVLYVKNIFGDIDCIKKPATKRDMVEALKVVNDIVSDIKKQTKAEPTIIMSGNGYQLLYAIPRIDLDDSNREQIQLQIQTFLKELIEKYSNDKVKLDQVGDLPRIIRITGTTNIKGGKVSKFVEVNQEESEGLKKYILSIKPPIFKSKKIQQKKEDIKLSKKFYKVLEKDEKIKKLYEGNFEGYDLSVGGELALVCFLIQYNFDKKEIFNIMSNAKIGRWAEKGISYREETYKKALAKISKGKSLDDFLIKKIKYNSKGEVCVDDEGKIILKSIVVNIDAVADYIIEKNNFKTIYGEKTEKIKYFDGKIFSVGARGLIKSSCERLLKSYAKKNVVEEIFDKIKRKTKTTPEEFEKTDLYLIPLENGCYDLKNKKLIPHSPEHNFTFLSPIEYNPDAKCPSWFKFIEEALYPEDIPIIKQWFGYNLFRQYFIKEAVIILGKKDVGKTIFLDQLIAFVGEKNKCGLSLQKISSGSDFTKFALKNKLSNVYDDLSSQDISDGGAFKIATGGGFISAEEKFGEFVQFKSYAKITLAGNKAPPVKDSDDDAYFSRNIPILFDNIPKKKNPFLRDKLQTKKELSGMLNWALEGLYEILKTGRFSFNKTSEEIKKIMQMSGDQLIQFGEECLEQSNEKISKEKMYEIYCLWANKNKKQILSKEQLGRRLNQKITYLIAKRNKSGRYWDNVSFNQECRNLQRNVDTLDTLQNIICFKKKSLNNTKNNVNNNNIYKVKKSVDSVADNISNKDILNTNSKKEKQLKPLPKKIELSSEDDWWDQKKIEGRVEIKD